MVRKISAVCLLLVMAASLIFGGNEFLKDSNNALESGDIIVSPEDNTETFKDTELEIVTQKNVKTSIQKNQTSVYPPFKDGRGYKIYENLVKDYYITDFDIDNEGNIYISNLGWLPHSPDRYKPLIEGIWVYSQDQELLLTISHEKMDYCRAVAVEGDKVYAFNYGSDEIFVFDKKGVNIGIHKVDIGGKIFRRMDVDNSGNIYILTSSDDYKTTINVFDKSFKKVCTIGGTEFEKQVVNKENELSNIKSIQSEDKAALNKLFNKDNIALANAEKIKEKLGEQAQKFDGVEDKNYHRRIENFCILDSENILITAEVQRLCLYNIAKNSVENVFIIDDDVSLAAYDKGVFYYTYFMKTKEEQNYGYPGPKPEFISRLKLDQSVLSSANKWSVNKNMVRDGNIRMEGIEIPWFNVSQNSHVMMKQDDKYIYFLDAIVSNRLNKNSVIDSYMMYRIEK